MENELLRIDIRYDHNDDGEKRHLVTPVYRRQGQVITVPDSRGHLTREAAVAEAREIARRNGKDAIVL